MTRLRIALLGGVLGSRAALERLARPEIDLLVLALDPSRAARHSDYCDLAPLAAAAGVPSRHIIDANAPTTLAALRDFAPDIIAVFGWSQLIGDEFAAIPRLGVLGWHPSLLPKNRGRAVIPWTILQGVDRAGLTIFWIDAGVDSGDIASQVEFAVAPDETATTLYEKVEVAAAAALDELIPRLVRGELPRRPQSHADATWCARRRLEDGRIDWRRSAEQIWTLIRASTHPYPGAWAMRDGTGITIWAASLSDERRYWGVPGQVQRTGDDGALIQCGDGRNLLVQRLSVGATAPQPAGSALRLHETLT